MIDSEEKNYLWQHFVFNAEQRLKAFNFFVIFSFFANGGVFAAAEKNLHGAVFILIGTFVAMSIVFWVIDARSQGLLQLAAPGSRITKVGFQNILASSSETLIENVSSLGTPMHFVSCLACSYFLV